MKDHILSIDQSTQGTKALLFDREGAIVARRDVPHRQLVSQQGWISHDLEEILRNTVEAARSVVAAAGIDKGDIAGIGISNQRETAAVWERGTGAPACDAIVWQCARGAAICEEVELAGHRAAIKERTGLNLSPYFSAAKFAWALRNCPGTMEKMRAGDLCCGTIDSWLIYRLTGGLSFKTDYSNASRTQLFNIRALAWDKDICGWFGIDPCCLAQVFDSNSCFGETDLFGFLDEPIPIHSAMGDSHGALYGQGCHSPGMAKVTYGTGSSVMMYVGDSPVFDSGLAASLAWGMDGQVSYVLEGNINYTGAVITWLKDDLGLIDTSKVAQLAQSANPADRTYLVPAFSGLGSPYWESSCTGIITGITRSTGKAELVKAAEECIAYQIADNVGRMQKASSLSLKELRVDGGPTRDTFLMQFQSDLLNVSVRVPEAEELSAIGAAYAAGIALGLYDRTGIFARDARAVFTPARDERWRKEKIDGWQAAVAQVLSQARRKESDL